MSLASVMGQRLDRDELDAVGDRLVEQARLDGTALTGPGGLLGGLTKRVAGRPPRSLHVRLALSHAVQKVLPQARIVFACRPSREH